jgi:hypothetical protein
LHLTAPSAEPFSPKEIALMNEKWLHRKAMGLAEAQPSAEPVAWHKSWLVKGGPQGWERRERVDRSRIVEPWLEKLNPVVRPLVFGDVQPAPIVRASAFAKEAK